ncbi:MAG: amino acid transporter [Rickettsiaceae bacterium]|nr:MAG: amino acid transporter [Rickettsiaceae bacterium]
MAGPFVKGFFTTASLIGGIGIQNIFVIKQGLTKSYISTVILMCWLIDVLLITLGVNGIGKLVISAPKLLNIIKNAGAIFLFSYGIKAFYSSYKNDQVIDLNHRDTKTSMLFVVINLLSVSFLNPHTYLDTMVLIGSVGAHFQKLERLLFISGAALASLSWFTILCYGARYLAPYFEKKNTWRIFNFFIGCMMFTIAISLLHIHYN